MSGWWLRAGSDASLQGASRLYLKSVNLQPDHTISKMRSTRGRSPFGHAVHPHAQAWLLAVQTCRFDSSDEPSPVRFGYRSI